jgi:hypothetical protein
MPRQSEEEKKPYNPFHLASGYAAPSIGNKAAIAVFKCFCNHTDFLGGSVSISIQTIVSETGWSEGSVNAAIRLLLALGRIKRKSRGRPGAEGGKQSSITTVFCTQQELERSGATEDNFYSRGGKGFVVKTKNQLEAERAECARSNRVKTQKSMSENANSPESKRKMGVVKTQPIVREPLKSEPLQAEPRKAEPLRVSDASSLRSPSTTKSKATSTPGAAREPIVPVERKTMSSSVRPPKYGLPAYITRAKKCEQTNFDGGEDGEEVPCGGIAVPNYRFCKSCLEAHQEFCRKHPESTDPDSALDKPVARGALA